MWNVCRIKQWGLDYFGVDDDGNVCVCPNPENASNKVKLTDIIKLVEQKKGLQLPTLVCFPQILQHRLKSINAAFKKAREDFDYKNDYFLVYPIKVNQSKRVVESLINSKETLGLEAGSKAELLAVLAYAGSTKTVIVCNGYKDRDYIRYALIGEKLGHKVYLVIEKMTEIQKVLEEAEKIGVKPRLGVRARLASQGHGKWQSSGGEQSKFGLSATQILSLVNLLKKENKLDSLQLLHFHLGSQISSIRDIAVGVHESARFYVELHQLGVNIQCFDVGGGLGVDYEGNRTLSDCSVEYGLNEYASTVVWGIGQACEEYNLPHPTIITESGRGVTAHHAVLVSNVIGTERFHPKDIAPPKEDSPLVLHSLWETWGEILESKEKRSPRSWINEGTFDLLDVQNKFSAGVIDLEERAWAEQLYVNICHKVSESLSEKNRAHRGLIDDLQERFADKMYVNFSLFRSLPDIWGIDQLFPVCPLTLLNKPVEKRALLLDITCDSDGIVDQFIDGDGIAKTMPMPAYDPEKTPLIGFFMVGAYQEILGNMHNLFGDTHSVDIVIEEKGKISIVDYEKGNIVSDMLQYVYLDPQQLIQRYRQQIESSNLTATEAISYLKTLEEGLESYTYLSKGLSKGK
ncbi:biosynthetic arginine decarboxylase [Neisseriaceae bacterium PsAf]|nr:biosynthetic arginine decarboxylase [Neisseriaceae bacterium PsAf]